MKKLLLLRKGETKMKRKMIIITMLLSLSMFLFSCTESGKSSSTSEEAFSATLGAGIAAIAEQIEHIENIE